MLIFIILLTFVAVYLLYYKNNATLEQQITSFIDMNDMKCAQIRISKNEKNMLSKNYGKEYTIWNKNVKCAPNDNTIFRIASVSKTITAAAILGMVSTGLFTLDTKLVDILTDLKPYDPRVNKITIRDLLRHSGGWDTVKGITTTPFTKDIFPPTITTLAPFDPQYDSLRFLPAITTNNIITFMMQFPLNFDPGTKYAYSNFGYNLLGRVIEEISGLSYEDYIKRSILNHANVVFIGSSDIAEKHKNEVYYYDGPQDDANYGWNYNIKYKVPSSYGSFDLKIMDSHGGWVMKINDLKIFGERLLGWEYFNKDLLKDILEKPSYVDENAKEFYSLGMRVIITDNDIILMHNGALTSGTFSVLSMHINSKMVTAFVANHLPVNIGKTISDYQNIIEEIV